MRRVWIGFFGFLAGVVVLSAVFSPPVYWGCDYFFPNTFPFRRVFNRMMMISALLLLYPLACYWNVHSWGKLGIKDSRWAKRWLLGIIFGIISILVLSWKLFTPEFEWSLNLTWSKGLQIVAGAIAVGFLEEILFRGIFFNALKDFFGKWMVVWTVLISGFFAMVHFIKAVDIPAPVNWASGWVMWLHVCPNLREAATLWPYFGNLFAVGLFLCAVVWRTKSLWLAMGLHTGWVIMLLISSKMQTPAHFSLKELLLTGWPTTFLLIVLAMVVIGVKSLRFDQDVKTSSHDPSSSS